ncbi:MAG TPA: RNA methyltransferase [Gemmatimonadales bacterium]|nr:RNA methyltransferase [Gemmatimonadales bacterium]
MTASQDAALLTMIRDLGRRRGRERRGLALAEGIRLVEEALAAGVAVRGAAVSPALEATPRGQALKSALGCRGVRLADVTTPELDALADTEHPQGVVAVIEPRAWALQDVPTPPGAVLLVLDAVQDPGNVGTILRTALGLGAVGVVTLKGTAELTNPKVLRGSMGASFRLPAVASETQGLLSWARERGVELWVAAADGAPIRRALDRSGRAPVAIVVGNEGAGVGPELAAVAARRVAIPLVPAAESLNVAVAAAILLYEVTRDA